MISAQPDSPLARRLVSSLYVEAMLLSDEARSYFDGYGRADRAAMDAVERVYLSCESLKVTTRLMHIIAWLLVQRGLLNGDTPDALPMRLGHADHSDPAGLIGLPAAARAIIRSSLDLYRRVGLLDADLNGKPDVTALSPALALQQSLASAF
jgi:regulator of CtrA degradation